jgi:hypothetical protein
MNASEHHESDAIDHVPSFTASESVTAASRIATPRATLPRSLFAIDV